jgi:hypothetical protein
MKKIKIDVWTIKSFYVTISKIYGNGGMRLHGFERTVVLIFMIRSSGISGPRVSFFSNQNCITGYLFIK